MIQDGSLLLTDVMIILILLLGIRQFRTPRGAWLGNITAAIALTFAAAVTLFRHGTLHPEVLLLALIAGSLAGGWIAKRAHMIQIPSMVAFQHGAGGIAAFLVAFVELTRTAGTVPPLGRVSGIIGLIVGAATFSGSMVAGAKLANRIKQTPVILPRHNLLLAGMLGFTLVLGAAAFFSIQRFPLFSLSTALIVFSIGIGIVFSIKIGGADMPVLISFLNATAGLAASLCGMIIQNRLLIACGATVAASGSILTHVMCQAMNRSLPGVFFGLRPSVPGRLPSQPSAPLVQTVGGDSQAMPRAIRISKTAKRVIVIPGYGMALAQAQFQLVELVRLFEAMGKEVRFAIHPVAGRMPGHMNVLLAEADVPYDKLHEMEEINPEFSETDLALIIGACDVVNPAAVETTGTPISGMPILKAHEARHVIVCNLDGKPGYSGVENPLYQDPKTILLFGDAKETLNDLETGVREGNGGGLTGRNQTSS